MAWPGSKVVTPLTLGAVRLISDGSSTIAYRIGTREVVRRADSAATPPIATSTSGWRRSTCAIDPGSCAHRPSTPAASTMLLSPSINPCRCNPWRSAARAGLAGDPW